MRNAALSREWARGGWYRAAPMGKTSRRDHLPERAEVEARAAVLLEALPYIREFAGATVVVKYGGAAMTKPERKASFARDIALLKFVGMNPVVVHGGGPDINAYSERLDLDVNFVGGLRVTDEPTMELVKMVLIGKVNKEIVAQLHVAGAEAVACLRGAHGAQGCVRARVHMRVCGHTRVCARYS